MDIATWVTRHGSVVHRRALRESGYTWKHVARAVEGGQLRAIRRNWVAEPNAPASLIVAAQANGRLTCVSLAERRGWWVSRRMDPCHVAIAPNSRRQLDLPHIRWHFGSAFATTTPHSIEDSLENALRHIAECLPSEDAIATWESAIRIEKLKPRALKMISWKSLRAQTVAESVTDFADSGLDSILIHMLSHLGLEVRPQWVIEGHPFDLLIGDALLIEVDGFAHHSGAQARGRDVKRDAELGLRGYTTLRFTYEQIMRDRHYVLRTIERAVAAGLHVLR